MGMMDVKDERTSLVLLSNSEIRSTLAFSYGQKRIKSAIIKPYEPKLLRQAQKQFVSARTSKSIQVKPQQNRLVHELS